MDNCNSSVTERRTLHVVVGILRNTVGQVLIALRPPHVYMPGLWEFPGGKVEADELPFTALQRELKEEIGVQVLKATPFHQHRHDYPDRRVLLDTWLIEDYAGDPQGCEGQSIRWVPLKDINQYTFPEGNQAIITQLNLLEA